jgi:preprotein translocase subunit SecE
MAKKEAKAKKENNKNKKSFFKDFKAELKKVNWPTPKQLLNNTTAVITIVFITAAIVFVLDVAFETINTHGIDKIKEVITSTDTTEEDTTAEDSDSEIVVEDEDEDNELIVEDEDEDNELIVEDDAETSIEDESTESTVE